MEFNESVIGYCHSRTGKKTTSRQLISRSAGATRARPPSGNLKAIISSNARKKTEFVARSPRESCQEVAQEIADEKHVTEEIIIN